MGIEEALFTRLAGNTTAGSAFYPSPGPHAPTYPHMTWRLLSSSDFGTREQLNSGTATALDISVISITIKGTTATSVLTLAREVKALMSGYQGESDSVNYRVSFENEVDRWDDAEGRHTRVQDYRIMHRPV